MMQNHECCHQSIVIPSPSKEHTFAFQVPGASVNLHQSLPGENMATVTLCTDTEVPFDLDQFIKEQLLQRLLNGKLQGISVCSQQVPQTLSKTSCMMLIVGCWRYLKC